MMAWICPPCRRGAHDYCMDVPFAREPLCHCTAGHVVTQRNSSPPRDDTREPSKSVHNGGTT